MCAILFYAPTRPMTHQIPNYLRKVLLKYQMSHANAQQGTQATIYNVLFSTPCLNR